MDYSTLAANMLYMRLFLSTFFCLLLIQVLPAQTPGKARMESFEKSKSEKSPFNGILFRNIGPTIMSGRITDIEVNPENSAEFYVSYASGGVWYSRNNGQSFKPVFDQQASMTIGDMAVNWKRNIIWVGTGEVNSSRSSYAGTGVYMSMDSGKTWVHKGLEESHHIGKIMLDPGNDKIAWVAVLGHLYSKNPERGIYKTVDGGKTWKQTLFINDSTGCTDIVMDPISREILYASSWTRTRSAWQFNGCGEGSGIYKSKDGGNTWKRLTDDKSGFPVGKSVGRIGLAISSKNSRLLYAVVDNNANQEKISEEEKSKLNARDIDKMNTATFLALDNKKLNDYLRDNNYPSQYTAEQVKSDIKEKKYTVHTLAEWRLADADASLFDTPIYGAEVYKTTDGGLTWRKTHEEVLKGVFFTYGYYFATIAISPLNDNKIWIGGYPIIASDDGGKTFKDIGGDNCHPDYHRIWVDPYDDLHLLACNDGGLNITYDGGQVWFKANNPAVGQFYGIAVDNEKPYNVYGGLQDNGTWYGPSTHTESNAWMQEGQYAYKNIGDGDGMQVQVDSRNQDVYVGSQFGNYYRVNKQSGDAEEVKPIYLIGEKPLRFNWQTPILLSKHNEDIFYSGSNCFHRSMKKGKDIEKLSGDLSSTKNKGNVPFGTITTISESPLRFGLLYVGTDDGNIHISKDVGYTWNKISNALPQNKWITRVVASKHKLERVYATLNNYRNDDFEAYVYVSNDFGKTWKDIRANLPLEPVNVIREDPTNEHILYVGTDNGLYVSMNDGKTYFPWKSNLPRVAIHDLAIQERENELVLGTHGRSIYIASLKQIQGYDQVKNQQLCLFKPDTINFNKRLGDKSAVYSKPIEDLVSLSYFTQQSGTHMIEVKNEKGVLVYSQNVEALYGFNLFDYDLSITESCLLKMKNKPSKAKNNKYYLPAGKYTVSIRKGDWQSKQALVIRSDK